MVMRIALGGVAGIVVGWFPSSNALSTEPVGTLSLPFMVAFVTGYSIDALFSLLDRLGRAVENIPPRR